MVKLREITVSNNLKSLSKFFLQTQQVGSNSLPGLSWCLRGHHRFLSLSSLILLADLTG